MFKNIGVLFHKGPSPSVTSVKITDFLATYIQL